MTKSPFKKNVYACAADIPNYLGQFFEVGLGEEENKLSVVVFVSGAYIPGHPLL